MDGNEAQYDPANPPRNVRKTRTGRWEVRIKISGVDRCFGTHDSIAGAVAARDVALAGIVREERAAAETARLERIAKARRERAKAIANSPGFTPRRPNPEWGIGLSEAEDSEIQWRIALERRRKVDRPEPALIPGWQYSPRED